MGVETALSPTTWTLKQRQVEFSWIAVAQFNSSTNHNLADLWRQLSAFKRVVQRFVCLVNPRSLPNKDCDYNIYVCMLYISREQDIRWMVAKSISHRLRNPGMIRFQQTMVSHCFKVVQDFVHPQS